MFKKTITNNGLRIITNRMPHTESVSIVFYIGTGSRHETLEESGISHFLEHILFKGSAKYPTAKEISEAIEGVGGVLNASTDRELTTYWCKVPSKDFRLALDVLSDFIKDPVLENNEIEKERQVILEELGMTYDIPSYRAELLIDEVMWPNQQLGRDVGGTRASVSDINKDMIINYMERQYTSKNMVVSIAGNIEHEYVIDTLSKTFSTWRNNTPAEYYTATDSQLSPLIGLVTHKTEQANLCLGFKGLPYAHKERNALDVLNTIIGEGMSSRLFLRLREEEGLVYDVHTTTSHLHDCGSLIAYAGVDPKNAVRAIESILDECSKVKDNVNDREMTKAIQYMKGRLLLRMEDTRSVAAWFGAQEILHCQSLSPQEILADIDKLQPNDIKTVARKVLTQNKLSAAIVGPFSDESYFKNSLKIN
jgi:predicted Zn-dependent peptidase